MTTPVKYNNHLRFDLSPERIKSLTDDIMAHTKKVLDEVANVPEGQHTFDNTVKKIADQEAEQGVQSANATFPLHVSTEKAVRDAAFESEQTLAQFNIEMSMREDVYKSVQEYAKKAEKLGEVDQRLVDKILLDFRRNGLALPDDKRNKAKEIKKKISDLCIKFQHNVTEDTSTVSLTKEELVGVPDAVMAGYKSEQKDGKEYFIVTMKYPDVLPALKYSKTEATRKKLDMCFNGRCKQNIGILEEIVALRHELAGLLGYPTHSSFVLDIRMAKTSEAVTEFYKNLTPKLDKLADSELQEMLKIKKDEANKNGVEYDGKINSWDFAYFHNLVEERNYNVNEMEIKEYFPLQVVVDGTLQIYQELLGLRFEKVADAHVWHEEASMYNVYDKETNQFVGQFYMDLFPREGKYTHAAAFPLQEGCVLSDGSWRHPASAMVCNFTKPVQDKPSLLKHGEVETFFHEFGHIMHGICSKAKYSRFAGTNTEQDFVECPSQMLENWCWKKDILVRISSHHATKEPLPDALLSKMIAAKNANSGLLNLRQVFFGVFDQTIHNSGKSDIGVLYNKLRQEITRVHPQEDTNGAATFAHLVGGYDSSYYGYLWSKVFASDLFDQFDTKGVMDAELGNKYRKIILENGGSKDGAVMLKEFLGRDPIATPFLKSIGLSDA